MNDKHSTLVTIWVMGVISIACSVLALLVSFAYGFSITYQAYSALDLFKLVPIITVTLITISIFQYRTQHYRKAYIYSLIPPIIYILYFLLLYNWKISKNHTVYNLLSAMGYNLDKGHLRFISFNILQNEQITHSFLHSSRCGRFELGIVCAWL